MNKSNANFSVYVVIKLSGASLIASLIVGKESTCNAGDSGSIPGPGRSSGEGEGYLLQYSRLENFMGCIVHGVTKSQTWLSDFHFGGWFTIQITFDSYSLIVKKSFWKLRALPNFWYLNCSPLKYIFVPNYVLISLPHLLILWTLIYEIWVGG